MESQPEVVVAAEALRGWVRAQRTAWAGPSRDSQPVSPPPVSVAVAPSRAPARPVVLVEAPPNRHELPAPAPPWLPDVSEFVVTPIAVRPAQVADRLPTLSYQVRPAATPRRNIGRIARRALAGLALVATLAAVAVAGRVGWSRYTAPKIGTANFTSEPAGARVLVDGTLVGSTPVKLDLPAGPHAVEFRLNAATRTQDITVVTGQQGSYVVNWNARRVGGMRVSSAPSGARVLVDGRDRGMTPLTLDDVTVGEHAVQIESSAGSVRRRIDIVEGRTQTLAESIYPGWLHVSAPIDVTVADGAKGVQLDDTNRVLLRPGVHTLRIANHSLGFSVERQVSIDPGGTSELAVDVPLSTLGVTGSAGADVFVDGVKAGQTPLTEYLVKLGTRDIMVVDPAGATRHRTVTITTQPAQLDISFTAP